MISSFEQSIDKSNFTISEKDEEEIIGSLPLPIPTPRSLNNNNNSIFNITNFSTTNKLKISIDTSVIEHIGGLKQIINDNFSKSVQQKAEQTLKTMTTQEKKEIIEILNQKLRTYQQIYFDNESIKTNLLTTLNKINNENDSIDEYEPIIQNESKKDLAIRFHNYKLRNKAKHAIFSQMIYIYKYKSYKNYEKAFMSKVKVFRLLKLNSKVQRHYKKNVQTKVMNSFKYLLINYKVRNFYLSNVIHYLKQVKMIQTEAQKIYLKNIILKQKKRNIFDKWIKYMKLFPLKTIMFYRLICLNKLQIASHKRLQHKELMIKSRILQHKLYQFHIFNYYFTLKARNIITQRTYYLKSLRIPLFISSHSFQNIIQMIHKQNKFKKKYKSIEIVQAKKFFIKSLQLSTVLNYKRKLSRLGEIMLDKKQKIIQEINKCSVISKQIISEYEQLYKEIRIIQKEIDDYKTKNIILENELEKDKEEYTQIYYQTMNEITELQMFLEGMNKSNLHSLQVNSKHNEREYNNTYNSSRTINNLKEADEENIKSDLNRIKMSIQKIKEKRNLLNKKCTLNK